MELKLNDKTLRKILIGIAVAAVIILIVNGLLRRSKYSYPPSASSTNTLDTTLRTDLATCESTYSQAYIAANGNAAAITTAQTALRDCVSGKVTTYVQQKCPYTSGVDPATMNPVNGPFGTGAATAWTAYQSDIRAIRLAYAPFILNPTDATTTTLTADIVRAARKADLTGATRKYLSTVCPATSAPGFYTSADYGMTTTTDASGLVTTTPTAGTTYPDPVSAKYNQWNVYTATPSGTTLTYGFYGGTSFLTRAKIATWAVGAGVIGTDGTAPTAGIIASGSKYSSASTSGIPNWVVARDFGPGTVGSAIPVSYTASSTAPVVTTTIDIPVAGYSYAG